MRLRVGVKSIKKQHNKADIETQIANLNALIEPASDWFIPLFEGRRKEDYKLSFRNQGAPAIATWGCSTQCDHCDGATTIRVSPFPWIWLEQLEFILRKSSVRFNFVQLFRGDYFRDYYDFVYDKDSSNILKLSPVGEVHTSGFERGSVAERAFIKALKRGGVVVSLTLSIAPNAWMRRLGIKKYAEHIAHIIKLAQENLLPSKYKVFLFRRISDPTNLCQDILEVLESKKMLYLIEFEKKSIKNCGRFWQLGEKGLFYPSGRIEAGDKLSNEDIDKFVKYSILPDGQAIRGIKPKEGIMLRRYETVEGLGPIAKEPIECFNCDLDCAGVKNKCPGRKELFRHWGLSAYAGFAQSNSSLKVLNGIISSSSPMQRNMTLGEAYTFFMKKYQEGFEKDLYYSKKLVSLILDPSLEPRIEKIMVVGDGLLIFPHLLTLVGKDITFVDVDEGKTQLVEAYAIAISNSLKKQDLILDLKIRFVHSEIGVFDIKQYGLKPHSFDLVTFIDFVGGRRIFGRPKEWLDKAKELLKPLGYLIIDETTHAADTMAECFPNCFPYSERLSGGIQGMYNYVFPKNSFYRVHSSSPVGNVLSGEILRYSLILGCIAIAVSLYLADTARSNRLKTQASVPLKIFIKDFFGFNGFFSVFAAIASFLMVGAGKIVMNFNWGVVKIVLGWGAWTFLNLLFDHLIKEDYKSNKNKEDVEERTSSSPVAKCFLSEEMRLIKQLCSTQRDTTKASILDVTDWMRELGFGVLYNPKFKHTARVYIGKKIVVKPIKKHWARPIRNSYRNAQSMYADRLVNTQLTRLAGFDIVIQQKVAELESELTSYPLAERKPLAMKFIGAIGDILSQGFISIDILKAFNYGIDNQRIKNFDPGRQFTFGGLFLKSAQDILPFYCDEIAQSLRPCRAWDGDVEKKAKTALLQSYDTLLRYTVSSSSPVDVNELRNGPICTVDDFKARGPENKTIIAMQKQLRPESKGGIASETDRDLKIRKGMWRQILAHSFEGKLTGQVYINKEDLPLRYKKRVQFGHIVVRGKTNSRARVSLGKKMGPFQFKGYCNTEYELEIYNGMPMRIFFLNDCSMFEFFPIIDNKTGRVIDVYRGRIRPEKFAKLKDVTTYGFLDSNGSLRLGGARPLVNGLRRARIRSWARFRRHPNERVRIIIKDGLVIRCTSLESDLDEEFALWFRKSEKRYVSSFWGPLSDYELSLLDDDYEIYNYYKSSIKQRIRNLWVYGLSRSPGRALTRINKVKQELWRMIPELKQKELDTARDIASVSGLRLLINYLRKERTSHQIEDIFLKLFSKRRKDFKKEVLQRLLSLRDILKSSNLGLNIYREKIIDIVKLNLSDIVDEFGLDIFVDLFGEPKASEDEDVVDVIRGLIAAYNNDSVFSSSPVDDVKKITAVKYRLRISGNSVDCLIDPKGPAAILRRDEFGILVRGDRSKRELESEGAIDCNYLILFDINRKVFVLAHLKASQTYQYTFLSPASVAQGCIQEVLRILTPLPFIQKEILRAILVQPEVSPEHIEEIEISNEENAQAILAALEEENIPLLWHARGEQWCGNVKLSSTTGEFYPFRYDGGELGRLKGGFSLGSLLSSSPADKEAERFDEAYAEQLSQKIAEQLNLVLRRWDGFSKWQPYYIYGEKRFYREDGLIEVRGEQKIIVIRIAYLFFMDSYCYERLDQILKKELSANVILVNSLSQKDLAQKGYAANTTAMIIHMMERGLDGYDGIDVGAGDAILTLAGFKLGLKFADIIELFPERLKQAGTQLRLNGFAEGKDYRSHLGDISDKDFLGSCAKIINRRGRKIAVFSNIGEWEDEYDVTNMSSMYLLRLIPEIQLFIAGGHYKYYAIDLWQEKEVVKAHQEFIQHSGFEIEPNCVRVGENENVATWSALRIRPGDQDYGETKKRSKRGASSAIKKLHLAAKLAIATEKCASSSLLSLDEAWARFKANRRIVFEPDLPQEEIEKLLTAKKTPRVRISSSGELWVWVKEGGWRAFDTPFQVIDYDFSNYMLGWSLRDDWIVKIAKSKPSKPVFVLDWGAGDLTAPIELAQWLNDKGINNVFIIAFSDTYSLSIAKKEIPDNILFIVGVVENLVENIQRFIGPITLDIIYSYLGLYHLVREGKFTNHIVDLAGLLSERGFIICNIFPTMIDAAKECIPEIMQELSQVKTVMLKSALRGYMFLGKPEAQTPKQPFHPCVTDITPDYKTTASRGQALFEASSPVGKEPNSLTTKFTDSISAEYAGLQGYLRQKKNSRQNITKVNFVVEGFRGKGIILEIGCGTAKTAKTIAERNPDVGVIATDIYESYFSLDYIYIMWAQMWEKGLLAAQRVDLDNLAVVRTDTNIIKFIPGHSLSHILLVNPEHEVLIELLEVINSKQISKKIKADTLIVVKPFFRKSVDLLESQGFRVVGKEIFSVNLQETSFETENAYLEVFVREAASSSPLKRSVENIFIARGIKQIKRIRVVCTVNVFRSPLLELVLQDPLDRMGIEIFSAGTTLRAEKSSCKFITKIISYCRGYVAMRERLARFYKFHNIEIVRADAVEQADIILVSDQSVLSHLVRYFSGINNKTFLMSAFLNPTHALHKKDIPDFEESLIHRGSKKLCTAPVLLELYAQVKRNLLREILDLKGKSSSSPAIDNKLSRTSLRQEILNVLKEIAKTNNSSSSSSAEGTRLPDGQGEDIVRAMPGIPRPARKEIGRDLEGILEGIGKEFDQLHRKGPKDEDLQMAIKYLRDNGFAEMADHLEGMARKGLLPVAPFERFLAAVINYDYEEHILISSNPYFGIYTSDPIQRAASFIYIIGATTKFNLPRAKNIVRMHDFLAKEDILSTPPDEIKSYKSHENIPHFIERRLRFVIEQCGRRLFHPTLWVNISRSARREVMENGLTADKDGNLQFSVLNFKEGLSTSEFMLENYEVLRKLVDKLVFVGKYPQSELALEKRSIAIFSRQALDEEDREKVTRKPAYSYKISLKEYPKQTIPAEEITVIDTAIERAKIEGLLKDYFRRYDCENDIASIIARLFVINSWLYSVVNTLREEGAIDSSSPVGEEPNSFATKRTDSISAQYHFPNIQYFSIMPIKERYSYLKSRLPNVNLIHVKDWRVDLSKGQRLIIAGGHLDNCIITKIGFTMQNLQRLAKGNWAEMYLPLEWIYKDEYRERKKGPKKTIFAKEAYVRSEKFKSTIYELVRTHQALVRVCLDNKPLINMITKESEQPLLFIRIFSWAKDMIQYINRKGSNHYSNVSAASPGEDSRIASSSLVSHTSSFVSPRSSSLLDNSSSPVADSFQLLATSYELRADSSSSPTKGDSGASSAPAFERLTHEDLLAGYALDSATQDLLTSLLKRANNLIGNKALTFNLCQTWRELLAKIFSGCSVENITFNLKNTTAIISFLPDLLFDMRKIILGHPDWPKADIRTEEEMATIEHFEGWRDRAISIEDAEGVTEGDILYRKRVGDIEFYPYDDKEAIFIVAESVHIEDLMDLKVLRLPQEAGPLSNPYLRGARINKRFVQGKFDVLATAFLFRPDLDKIPQDFRGTFSRLWRNNLWINRIMKAISNINHEGFDQTGLNKTTFFEMLLEHPVELYKALWVTNNIPYTMNYARSLRFSFLNALVNDRMLEEIDELTSLRLELYKLGRTYSRYELAEFLQLMHQEFSGKLKEFFPELYQPEAPNASSSSLAAFGYDSPVAGNECNSASKVQSLRNCVSSSPIEEWLVFRTVPSHERRVCALLKQEGREAQLTRYPGVVLLKNEKGIDPSVILQQISSIKELYGKVSKEELKSWIRGEDSSSSPVNNALKNKFARIKYHGEAYKYWEMLRILKGIMGAILIHIDAHEDAGAPLRILPQPKTVKEAKSITYAEDCYIFAGVLYDLIDEIWQVYPQGYALGIDEEFGVYAAMFKLKDGRKYCYFGREHPQADGNLRIPQGAELIRLRKVKMHVVHLDGLPDFKDETRPIFLDFDADFFACIGDKFHKITAHYEFLNIIDTPAEEIEKIINEKIIEDIRKTIKILRDKNVNPAFTTVAESLEHAIEEFIDFIVDNLISELNSMLINEKAASSFLYPSFVGSSSPIKESNSAVNNIEEKVRELVNEGAIDIKKFKAGSLELAGLKEILSHRDVNFVILLHDHSKDFHVQSLVLEASLFLGRLKNNFGKEAIQLLFDRIKTMIGEGYHGLGHLAVISWDQGSLKNFVEFLERKPDPIFWEAVIWTSFRRGRDGAEELKRILRDVKNIENVSLADILPRFLTSSSSISSSPVSAEEQQTKRDYLKMLKEAGFVEIIDPTSTEEGIIHLQSPDMVFTFQVSEDGGGLYFVKNKMDQGRFIEKMQLEAKDGTTLLQYLTQDNQPFEQAIWSGNPIVAIRYNKDEKTLYFVVGDETTLDIFKVDSLKWRSELRDGTKVAVIFILVSVAIQHGLIDEGDIHIKEKISLQDVFKLLSLEEIDKVIREADSSVPKDIKETIKRLLLSLQDMHDVKFKKEVFSQILNYLLDYLIEALVKHTEVDPKVIQALTVDIKTSEEFMKQLSNRLKDRIIGSAKQLKNGDSSSPIQSSSYSISLKLVNTHDEPYFRLMLEDKQRRGKAEFYLRKEVAERALFLTGEDIDEGIYKIVKDQPVKVSPANSQVVLGIFDGVYQTMSRLPAIEKPITFAIRCMHNEVALELTDTINIFIPQPLFHYTSQLESISQEIGRLSEKDILNFIKEGEGFNQSFFLSSIFNNLGIPIWLSRDEMIARNSRIIRLIIALTKVPGMLDQQENSSSSPVQFYILNFKSHAPPIRKSFKIFTFFKISKEKIKIIYNTKKIFKKILSLGNLKRYNNIKGQVKTQEEVTSSVAGGASSPALSSKAKKSTVLDNPQNHQTLSFSSSPIKISEGVSLLLDCPVALCRIHAPGIRWLERLVARGILKAPFSLFYGDEHSDNWVYSGMLKNNNWVPYLVERGLAIEPWWITPSIPGYYCDDYIGDRVVDQYNLSVLPFPRNLVTVIEFDYYSSIDDYDPSIEYRDYEKVIRKKTKNFAEALKIRNPAALVLVTAAEDRKLGIIPAYSPAGQQDMILGLQIEVFKIKFESTSSPVGEENITGKSLKERLRTVLNREVFSLPAGKAGIRLNKVKSFLGKAIIILLLLSLVFHSGCATPGSGAFTHKQIKIAERALKRKNYGNALIYYWCVSTQSPKLFRAPEMTNEIKKGLVDGYIQMTTGAAGQHNLYIVEPKLFYPPGDVLIKLGVTHEELYGGYLRALKSDNFRTPFYAARVLACLGDSLAKDTLMKALKGDYNADEFKHEFILRLLLPNKWTTEEIRERVFVLTVFSLAQLGSPQAVKYLIDIISNPKKYDSNLKGRDINVMEEAIVALSKLGGSKATSYLIELLEKAEYKEFQSNVIFALGRIGGREVLPVLIKAAKDYVSGTRCKIISSLVQFKEQEVTDLLFEFVSNKDEEVSVRVAAMLALSDRIDDNPKIIDLIGKILREEDVNGPVKYHLKKHNRYHSKSIMTTGKCVWSDGSQSYYSSGQDVQYVLVNPKVEIGYTAVLVYLNNLKKHPELIEPLYQKLCDISPSIPPEVVIALINYVDDYPQLRKFLDEALKGKDKDTKKRILAGLAQVKSKYAVDMIKPYLDSPDISIKQTAVLSLGFTKDQRALAELIRTIMENTELIRAIAIHSFVQIPEAPIVNLKPYLYDESKIVRLTTINALSGKVADIPQIKDSFIEIVKTDPDPLVRSAAIAVLSDKIKENSQITDLTIELLNKARDNNVKLACVNSLRGSKEPQAIAAITRMLNDKEVGIQQATAIALSPHIEDYPQLKEPIEEILKKSNNPDFQKRILLNLGQSKSGYAVDMIKPYLNSPDIPTKQVAVFSLGLTEDKRALTELSRIIKEDNAIIRATAIQSFAKVPDAPLKEVIPYLEDDSQKVRLAAVEGLSGKVTDMPAVSKSFIKIAKIDPDPLVRSAATLGLGWGNINKPEAIEAIKDNLHSDNLGLGRASALALGRINSPATLAPLTSIALDTVRDNTIRSIAVQGLGSKITQYPNIANDIKPLLDDKSWQIRSVAVDAIGRLEQPSVDNLLTPALKDDSVFVRRSAIANLGVRVHENPQLVNPLADALKQEPDTWNRAIAALSLKTIEPLLAESVRPQINQNIPKIDVAIVIPGVDDSLLGFNPYNRRDLNVDVTGNRPFIRILKLSGIKVIEHSWTGNIFSGDIRNPGKDILDAQLRLDGTMLKAKDIVGEKGRIMAVMYSGGNLVGERFLSPDLDPRVRQLFDEHRVHLVSLGSPSWRDFSSLDQKWENIALQGDPVYNAFGFKAFGINRYDSIYPYRINDFKDIAGAHLTYNDPLVISHKIHEIHPNLNMPNLDIMIRDQDVSKWHYFPRGGNWPGIYNFEGVAAPGVWKAHTKGYDSTQPNYHIRPNMLTPSMSDTWRQKHIMGETPFERYREPLIPQTPVGIIPNYQQQLQRDLQQFNVPKTPLIDTIRNYRGPNTMRQFPNINRIYNPPPEIKTNPVYQQMMNNHYTPPVYNPPPVYIPPTPNYRDPFKPQFPVNIDMPPVYTPPPIHIPSIPKY